MKKITILLISVFVLSVVGCGGGDGDVQPDLSLQPCEVSTSLSGTIDDVDLSQVDLSYNSALYNESDEAGYPDEMYDYLSLDKNDADDVRLMQYILSAANYRLIIGRDAGVRESVIGDAGIQYVEELNIFIYDLEGYNIGDWIEIEDVRHIETYFKYGSNEEAYAALAALFRDFMDDGRPNAVAGFNADRTQDSLLLQDLVNVFSPRTVQAIDGHIALTSVVESGVRRNGGELSQPYSDISMVSGEFWVDFYRYGAGGDYCLPVQIN